MKGCFMNKKTQQEVLAVIRYQITIAPDGIARRNLWDLYFRVAGGHESKGFQKFLFSELVYKRGGFLAVLALGFFCAFFLDTLAK